MRRRVFLGKTAGLSLGLPLLESLGGVAKAQDETTGNLVVFRQANGMIQGAPYGSGAREPDYFWPKQTGALSQNQLQADAPERATGLLAPFASKLLLVKRVQSHYAGRSGGDHFDGHHFCCSKTKYVGGMGDKYLVVGHESIDTRVERELNGQTEPLALFAGSGSYVRYTVSFNQGGRPNALESNPANAFRRIVDRIPQERIGDGGASDPSAQDSALLAQQRRGVNDLIKVEIDRLRNSSKLSLSDKKRLSDHFDHVRTVEVAVMENEQTPGALPYCQPPGEFASAGDTDDHQQLMKNADLQAQVAALAFACGVKRAAVLQIGDGTNHIKFGQPYAFHAISHRVTRAGAASLGATASQNYHKEIDRYHAQMFLRLLERLDAVPAGNGTLLDQTAAVYTSAIQNGSHWHDELPFVIGGGRDLGLAQGKYFDSQHASLKKVWCTIAGAVGCKDSDGAPISNFGDSDQEGGQLPAMLA